MNISLTPELEKFIAQEVEGGLYQTASEVVRAALRRLKNDKKTLRLPELPATLEELEQRLMEGIERLDRGEGIDGKESRRRMFARIKKTLANGDLHA
jgi:antitoxin ParD1/3/4